MAGFDLDVVVIGGCGHVGLPLAIAFADRGARTGSYDVNAAAVATVIAGRMPFAAPGAARMLDSSCAADLRSGQILILRSTGYPGVTALAEKMVVGLGVEMDVAFCPERIAEGQAMTQLAELPQLDIWNVLGHGVRI